MAHTLLPSVHRLAPDDISIDFADTHISIGIAVDAGKIIFLFVDGDNDLDRVDNRALIAERISNLIVDEADRRLDRAALEAKR